MYQIFDLYYVSFPNISLPWPGIESEKSARCCRSNGTSNPSAASAITT